MSFDLNVLLVLLVIRMGEKRKIEYDSHFDLNKKEGEEDATSAPAFDKKGKKNGSGGHKRHKHSNK